MTGGSLKWGVTHSCDTVPILIQSGNGTRSKSNQQKVDMEGESNADKAKAVGSAFVPHPTFAILRFWQGIVEIILRAAVIVSLPRSVFVLHGRTQLSHVFMVLTKHSAPACPCDIDLVLYSML